jgi:hypothetical protein
MRAPGIPCRDVVALAERREAESAAMIAWGIRRIGKSYARFSTALNPAGGLAASNRRTGSRGHFMQYSGNWVRADGFRRLVLGGMFAVGLALATAPQMASVRAADRGDATLAQADAGAPAVPKAPAAPQAPAIPDAKTKPAAPSAGGKANDANADDADEAQSESIRGDNHGIVIQKGHKKIRIEGLGLDRDREYDSFEQFVQDAPWLAGLFFLVVMLLFLVPLLIIVLLIWYKLRKNRLANETMLKLAERGVVPPATAMDAVAAGTAASVAAAATAPAPPGNPAYDQARYLHRRTVWSDLRKGIIMCAIGLALSFWSILDDGTANSVGLILLFVGLGYCLLWFFEDRTTSSRSSGVPPPPGSA